MKPQPKSLWRCTSCGDVKEYKRKICHYTDEDYVCNHKEFVEYKLVEPIASFKN